MDPVLISCLSSGSLSSATHAAACRVLFSEVETILYPCLKLSNSDYRINLKLPNRAKMAFNALVSICLHCASFTKLLEALRICLVLIKEPLGLGSCCPSAWWASPQCGLLLFFPFPMKPWSFLGSAAHYILHLFIWQPPLSVKTGSLSLFLILRAFCSAGHMVATL